MTIEADLPEKKVSRKREGERERERNVNNHEVVMVFSKNLLWSNLIRKLTPVVEKQLVFVTSNTTAEERFFWLFNKVKVVNKIIIIKFNISLIIHRIFLFFHQ